MSSLPPYGYLLDYLWWWLAVAALSLHTWCFFRLSRRWSNQRRLVTGNVLITVTLLVLAGAIGETYFRYFHLETDAVGLTMSSRRWLALHADLNSAGFRDREWAESPPPGTYRIAFVGDSFTFGWGIENPADRFSDVIGRRIAEAGSDNVEVLNTAKGGWETGDQLEAARRAIGQWDVNEVVLCYCPNDIDDLAAPVTGSAAAYPPQSAIVDLETSFLLDFLYVQLVARRSGGVQGYFDRLAATYADPQSWAIQCLRFDVLSRLCQDNGVRLRVVLLPLPRFGSSYDPRSIHEQVAAFFTGKGVEVVDLLPTIEGIDPDEIVVNAQDYHPNERAHAMFAERIWEAFYAGQGGAAEGGQAP